MPILKEFERRLEGLVEGFFAKTFRSGLQPIELAKRLLREMDSGKTVFPREVQAPNHFEFHLSKLDRLRFEQAEPALVAELKQVVRQGARERGWGLVGPPQIAFETDERLGKGEFRCEATLVAGPDDEPEPEPPRATTHAGYLVLVEGGKPRDEFPLDKQVVTIGRLPECDVTVADPGASRRHAQIREQGGVYTITDLGSTNGTMVNNRAVTAGTQLSDGDLITIGNTVLEFRRS